MTQDDGGMAASDVNDPAQFAATDLVSKSARLRALSGASRSGAVVLYVPKFTLAAS
jgi:hypothetical protein